MKATVVPAQVTTVEDRVAGNLSVTQLILFAIPIFGGSLLYAALPPSMEFSLYKLLLIGVLAAISLISAIRIRGKIVLLWAITLSRYWLRPQHYLFTKNTSNYRSLYGVRITSNTETTLKSATAPPKPQPAKLDLKEEAAAYAIIDNPRTLTHFKTTKKGGLHVYLNEIKE